MNGLETVWEGGVDELRPPPPAGLGRVFGEGGYVTRLEATAADPSRFTSDLQIDPAVAGEDAATVAPVADEAAPEDDSGISTAALIAIIAAGFAFAAGLVLLTRPPSG